MVKRTVVAQEVIGPSVSESKRLKSNLSFPAILSNQHFQTSSKNTFYYKSVFLHVYVLHMLTFKDLHLSIEEFLFGSQSNDVKTKKLGHYKSKFQPSYQ